ncbi:MAG: EAL domain-containing protein [Oscillospiraceae bacterium]
MKTFSKNEKKKGIFFKIFLPMLILVIIQLITFVTVTFVSGEFSYVKDYAFDNLSEKTENRKNYIENNLQQKTNFVVETANDINLIVTDILSKNNASIDDITSNKDLNKQIIEASAENLIYLLRRDMVNDVFIILETDNLYKVGNYTTRTGMYIRDFDPQTNSNDNKDLLLEFGNSSLVSNLNITLDFEWSSYLEFKDENLMDNFYFKTVQTAKKNLYKSLIDLGYWSDFSSISDNAEPSLKFTVPLIIDNQVYGAIGIGLLEKSILKDLPSNDFLSEQACYILGADTNEDGNYSVFMHSGSIYNRLVDETTELNNKNPIDDSNTLMYNFNNSNNIPSIGLIKRISLYNSSSPYYNQKWALICVANKDNILQVYTKLVNNFFIASIVSLTIGLFIVLLVSRGISKPISNIILKLNGNNEYHEIIKFNPTNILEVDQLTNAITELQINVKEYSSMVSKIIAVADVQIGVFMCDYSYNTVFIGESLIKLLNFNNIPKEDTYITMSDFKKHLSKIDENGEIWNTILETKTYIDNHMPIGTIVKTFSVGKSINQKWFKLSINQNKSNIIGVIQDVTTVVLEKQKIEYERDYDTTTGLLNRRAYLKNVEQKFSNPSKLKISAFMMWDLDNLKYVNDTYGHDFGDDYIKTAANVFKQFKDYGCIVARMSGDEFNIFFSGFDSKEEILKIIYKVRDNLLNSYCLLSDGTHYKIRASGGISFYPQDSTSYDMLIKYADFAMYTIKHSTKGAIAEFDVSSYNKDSILVTGIEEMNKVIDEHSIKYAYQTIMDVRTGEVYGYEALMRPQSSVFKSPLELIRIAKTCAKLYEIEHLTWIEAIKPFHQAIQNGDISKNTRIFINSISNCIINNDDIKIIETQYKDILPNIVMEILESEQTNNNYIKIKQELIKKWNGKLALDDFGSGYNSEYTLITLNPNIIKIDRSIISGCDTDISRRNIISSLVSISKLKNIMVLAEGVETIGELKTVMTCGVDLVQGYLVSRPVFDFLDVPEDIKSQVRQINKETKKFVYKL